MKTWSLPPKYSIALVICRKDYPRAQILRSIDDSLRRLGMDYVDILQIHRWDYNTPIEETLEALNDVVKSRESALYRRVINARFAVCSGTGTPKTAWLGAVCQYAGSLQSDLSRRRARDAATVLSGGRGGDSVEPAGAGATDASVGEKLPPRLVSDEVGKNLYKESDENDAQIAERLTGVSEELGATRAQVALAWLLSKPGIAAPIIGTSREEQLDELLNAVDITLKPAQIAELETPYKPHPVVGFK